MSVHTGIVPCAVLLQPGIRTGFLCENGGGGVCGGCGACDAVFRRTDTRQAQCLSLHCKITQHACIDAS